VSLMARHQTGDTHLLSPQVNNTHTSLCPPDPGVHCLFHPAISPTLYSGCVTGSTVVKPTLLSSTPFPCPHHSHP
jgi:hypothetical protein